MKNSSSLIQKGQKQSYEIISYPYTHTSINSLQTQQGVCSSQNKERIRSDGKLQKNNVKALCAACYV